MRKRVGLAFLAVVFVVPVWAQDKGAEDEKLVGSWTNTKVEFDGNVIDSQDMVNFTFAKGGKLTIKPTGKEAMEGTWKTNPAKNPKEIDLAFPKGPDNKLVTLKAVYQVEGDTFKLAFSFRDPEDRPKAFDSKVAPMLIFKKNK